MATEIVTTEPIRYRQIEKADLNEMLDLWSNHSGWGDLTMDDFLFWYEQNPHGKGIIVVAEDENRRILGATSFVPARLFAGKKTFKVLRAVSQIVQSSYRHGDLRHSQHLAFGMLTNSFRIYKEDEVLISFSASRIKQKEKQWEICDLLFADSGSSLRSALWGTLSYACDMKEIEPEAYYYEEICLLDPLLMQDILQDLGFEKDNYNFHLLIQKMDRSIPDSIIEPSGWLVGANN